MVDWEMVRSWPWHFRDVSARTRVYCEDCGDVSLDLGFLTRSHSPGHFDTARLDPFLRPVAFDYAL
jgi:hypothetical protein